MKRRITIKVGLNYQVTSIESWLWQVSFEGRYTGTGLVPNLMCDNICNILKDKDIFFKAQQN